MKRICIYLIIICTSLYSCNTTSEKKENIGNSLYEIKRNKKLKVAMDYNSINYFIYKGKALGFQYDIAKAFADYLGVHLEVVVSNNLEDSFKILENGECHILATSLARTEERAQRFNFSFPIGESATVLVQRKSRDSSYIIKDVQQLKNKTVYAKNKSEYEKTLKSFNKKYNLNIKIISVKNFSTEDLIGMVSHKEIDYSISDENIAYINSRHFRNINISTILSDKRKLAWGINKKQTELKTVLDKWLKGFVGSYTYNVLYKKYYDSRRAVNRYNSPYFTLKSGTICKYDSILKEKSKLIKWDWRLLASLMYQESRFDPEAKSWVGATGLMQIMPETANMVRMKEYETPENNIETGVKYIRYLINLFNKKLEDKTDIIPFVLASYNVGPGHVFDARRLAVKYGKNPDKWYENTDFFLRNKANPLYYKDNLSRNGYCNGEEPYNYVKNILELYEHYKNIIKE